MNETIQLKFNGSIPQNYDDYLGPMFFEPYAQEVGKLIDASSVGSALEIACGTGRLTKHLRRALASDARLVASDLSTDMLSVAKKKLADDNIEWMIADAQGLPFEANSFDLVVCYFGLMLVPDKSQAFREALRVLKKGGMLLMATWDKLEHNEASNVFRLTLKSLLGDTLPDSYKLPFSLYDQGLITTMLNDAGFVNVHSEKVKKESIGETSEKATYGLINGGSLYNEIVKRDPALIGQITASVEEILSQRYGHAPMISPMSAIITRAWK